MAMQATSALPNQEPLEPGFVITIIYMMFIGTLKIPMAAVNTFRPKIWGGWILLEKIR